jgi:hypothetical protein
VFDIALETTTFYDENRPPVTRIQRNEITGTLTNTVTGGSLPTAGIRIFHYDLVTGALFTTGSNNVTKLPGDGFSIPGAGRATRRSPNLAPLDGAAPDTAPRVAGRRRPVPTRNATNPMLPSTFALIPSPQ